ncbi:MAG: hypothetical protein FD146_1450 [Anaerolineaceae bacterium]|nr:MAG: hypothetical protein FD146_1450 [Anaerolineaceae bacterium]
MRNTVFKPRYSFKGLWDVLLLSLGLLFSSLFGFMKFGINPIAVLQLILLVVFTFWWLHSLIRQIVFTPSAFIVERYIWPSRAFAYTDVIDIGILKIKTRKGYIVFSSMSNRAEAIKLFKQLIEQDKIHPHQIENRIFAEETIHYKVIIPSIVISLILWGVFVFFWRYYQFRFSELGNLLIYALSFVPIFLLVYYIVYWITKERLKNQSNAG